MKKIISYGLGLLFIVNIQSCVSKKKFLESEGKASNMARMNRELRDDIGSLQSRLKLMEEANESAAGEIDEQRMTISERERLIAEKEGMLGEKDEKIRSLQAILDKQKENTEKLRSKLAKALGNFKSEDLNVYSKNGKVYVSLSEKLLFPSGSADVNAEGKDALEQVANALKGNDDIHINIEGHTDSIPIKIKFQDNWALSVARSTSIVRLLTTTYGIDPQTITASGRSQFEPVADNATTEGRAKNRRTEIIIAPKLDELMQLINE